MKKLRVVLMCALALVTVYAVAAVAQEIVGDEELSSFATMVTTLLAGTLGVWIAQGLKKLLPAGLGDKLMTWIAYVAAFCVAIVAFAVSGGLKTLLADPWAVIQNLVSAGGFMTLAYSLIKGHLGIKSKSDMVGGR